MTAGGRRAGEPEAESASGLITVGGPALSVHGRLSLAESPPIFWGSARYCCDPGGPGRAPIREKGLLIVSVGAPDGKEAPAPSGGFWSSSVRIGPGSTALHARGVCQITWSVSVVGSVEGRAGVLVGGRLELAAPLHATGTGGAWSQGAGILALGGTAEGLRVALETGGPVAEVRAWSLSSNQLNWFL